MTLSAFFVIIAIASATLLTTCNLFGPDEVQLSIQLEHSAGLQVPTEAALALAPRATAPEIGFYVGFKAAQSGCLVAGNSSRSDATMSFTLSAIARDGETILGAAPTAEAEEFVLPDPSIIQGDLADGTAVWAPGRLGMFIARFSPDGSTQLLATPELSDSFPMSTFLSEVDEVVMRTSLIGEPAEDANAEQIPDTLVITSPHFVVDTGDGPVAYHDQNVSLSINGETEVFTNFEYVIFVPASVVGEGFNYFVHGDQTVFDPVLGDEMECDANQSCSWVNDPSTWTLNPEWINNADGNAGLFEMIDVIADVGDPVDRMGNARWVELANYFQGFFAKFYLAGSTMFNVGSGLGSGGNSSFQLIALDDTNGPLLLDQNAVLSVTYAPGDASFVVNGDMLEITADPPLEFQTAVVNAE